MWPGMARSMSTRTRVTLSVAAALTAVGGIVAAHASSHTPDQVNFVSQLTNIEFLTANGPSARVPNRPEIVVVIQRTRFDRPVQAGNLFRRGQPAQQ